MFNPDFFVSKIQSMTLSTSRYCIIRREKNSQSSVTSPWRI